MSNNLSTLSKYRIGIDIGGTNVKFGIVDESNKIIDKNFIKTQVPLGWQKIIENIGKEVLILLEKNKIFLSQCKSMGIGSPGVADHKNGILIYSNNLIWENVPLVKELNKYINLPIKLSNDANCAALGEVVAGRARGYKNAVMITLGTGVGGGVVADGKLFEGGIGGIEVGHMVLVVDGVKCTCGRNGCFESYASATALVREAKEAARKNPDSLMNKIVKGDIDKISGVTPFEASKRGDAVGKKVVENYIKYLGEGIVDMVNIFRPDIVLLSGGICNQGRYLTDPLNNYVKKYTYAGSRIPIPSVEVATLGNDAGLIGAANL